MFLLKHWSTQETVIYYSNLHKIQDPPGHPLGTANMQSKYLLAHGQCYILKIFFIFCVDFADKDPPYLVWKKYLINEITKELILHMVFWSWSWIVREPRVLWAYVFLCQAPVPREHLSSYNAVIMGLYSLDLLSWNTDGLGAGDRKQKEKK